MSVTKLSGLFLFYFFFLFLFFFSKVGLVLSGSIIRVSSCQICHVSTPAQISGAPWLNRSRFIISLPFSRGNSENWRDPWRRFQIKLTPPTQLTSLQSAEPVAHVGDAVAWNRASFLCFFSQRYFAVCNVLPRKRGIVCKVYIPPTNFWSVE